MSVCNSGSVFFGGWCGGDSVCLVCWCGGFLGFGSVSVVVLGSVLCGGVVVSLVLEVSVWWSMEVLRVVVWWYPKLWKCLCVGFGRCLSGSVCVRLFVEVDGVAGFFTRFFSSS